ncbi:MAG: VUT family protein [Proteobacteria bacterium]|nr:VUT family protein [Pseudomonadota bacterium]
MNAAARIIIAVGAYVAAIVLVNWLFAPSQLVEGVTQWTTASWGTFYLANLVVGFVFVLRDYAQREIGHKILLATLVAGIITYFMVDPTIALASITAFVLSELADWAVYSFWKKPLQQRILVSSLIAVPLDTFAFQHLANYLTPAAFTTEVASKAIGVLLVWYLLKLRAGNSGTPAAAH